MEYISYMNAVLRIMKDNHVRNVNKTNDIFKDIVFWCNNSPASFDAFIYDRHIDLNFLLDFQPSNVQNILENIAFKQINKHLSTNNENNPYYKKWKGNVENFIYYDLIYYIKDEYDVIDLFISQYDSIHEFYRHNLGDYTALKLIIKEVASLFTCFSYSGEPYAGKLLEYDVMHANADKLTKIFTHLSKHLEDTYNNAKLEHPRYNPNVIKETALVGIKGREIIFNTMRRILQRRIQQYYNHKSSEKYVKEGYSDLLTILINSILYTYYIINQINDEQMINVDKLEDNNIALDPDTVMAKHYTRDYKQVAMKRLVTFDI